MTFGKVKPLSMMALGKSRPFGLDHSLETVFFNALQTVCTDTDSGGVSWSDLVTWVAVSALPVLIIQMAWHIVVEFSFEGLPPWALGRAERSWERSLLTVE